MGLDKFDLFNAIFDRAQNYSLKTVYLATDGWIRGPHGAALVKEVPNNVQMKWEGLGFREREDKK